MCHLLWSLDTKNSYPVKLIWEKNKFYCRIKEAISQANPKNTYSPWSLEATPFLLLELSYHTPLHLSVIPFCKCQENLGQPHSSQFRVLNVRGHKPLSGLWINMLEPAAHLCSNQRSSKPSICSKKQPDSCGRGWGRGMYGLTTPAQRLWAVIWRVLVYL